MNERTLLFEGSENSREHPRGRAPMSSGISQPIVPDLSQECTRVPRILDTHPVYTRTVIARRGMRHILTARYFITADQSARAAGSSAPNHHARQQLIPGRAGTGAP